MADLNIAQAGTLSPEDYAQQQALSRQQRFAEMLMQQNQQPQGQMISGRYVAPSFAQMLQPVANMLAGAYVGKQSDTEAAKLAAKIREAKNAKEEEIAGYIAGTPEKRTELAGPYAGNIPMPTAVTPATKPDYDAALRAISTNNPYGVGKEEKAAIIGSKILKPTELQQNYRDWLNSGNKGSIIDYQRQVANLKAEHPTFSPVETSQGMFTMNSRTGQLAPVMMNGQQVMGNKGNLPEAANKQVLGAVNLKDAISNYQTTLKDFGTLDMVNPDARAKMGNAYNNMMLQAKEAYNLGVLNGPDYQILQSVVKDPTKLNALLVSQEALQNQATDLSKQADTIISNVYKTHNRPVPANMVTPAANPAAAPTTPTVQYATNGKTRIMSTDGGNTWQPAGSQ